MPIKKVSKKRRISKSVRSRRTRRKSLNGGKNPSYTNHIMNTGRWHGTRKFTKLDNTSKKNLIQQINNTLKDRNISPEVNKQINTIVNNIYNLWKNGIGEFNGKKSNREISKMFRIIMGKIQELKLDKNNDSVVYTPLIGKNNSNNNNSLIKYSHIYHQNKSKNRKMHKLLTPIKKMRNFFKRKRTQNTQGLTDYNQWWDSPPNPFNK